MQPQLYTSEPDTTPPNRNIVDLTKREWEVLMQVANDLSNAEIAERLSITPGSVKNYRHYIGIKLDLRGCRSLARFARRYARELRDWYELLTGESAPPVDL